VPGTLYVVATPIGNLEDLTLRALRVLKEVDLIACEDTRRTRQLLARYGISTPVTSYFEHNKLRKGEALLRHLREGRSVALVTDAGTPGISDPGFLLVEEARAAGVRVVPVPGPSAAVAALSAAGIPADRFLFEGFLPAKPGRRRARLRALRELDIPVVLYEAPHRLLKTLAAIGEVFGEVLLVVARELTKQFEEIRVGPLSEQVAHFESRAIKGEFTIIISPPSPHTMPPSPLSSPPVGERAG